MWVKIKIIIRNLSLIHDYWSLGVACRNGRRFVGNQIRVAGGREKDVGKICTRGRCMLSCWHIWPISMWTSYGQSNDDSWSPFYMLTSYGRNQCWHLWSIKCWRCKFYLLFRAQQRRCFWTGSTRFSRRTATSKRALCPHFSKKKLSVSRSYK